MAAFSSSDNSSRTPVTAVKVEESPHMRHLSHAVERVERLSLDGGFYRVAAKTSGASDSEKLRTYVVLEVVNGQQVLRNWTCADLVAYVNELGLKREAENEQRKRKETEFTGPENGVSGTNSTEEIVRAIAAATSGATHVHFHYHSTSSQAGAGKKSSSQQAYLSYRDVRQVFTDGAPVASVEIRRHCIIICLPPLSCIIMDDRFFLLVCEDLESEALLTAIRKTQLARTGPVGGGVFNSGHLHDDAASANETSQASTTFNEEEVRKGETQSLELPFEYDAFEIVAAAALKHLDHDISSLESQLINSWEVLVVPSPEGSELLHHFKHAISRYSDRVDLFDRAFERLMKDEGMLEDMQLATHAEGQLAAADISSDMMVLLEYFDQEIEIFRQKLRGLQERLESRDRINHMRMLMNRYEMARWEVAGSLLGAGFGLCGAIGGTFGMNLTSGWEETENMFATWAGVILFTACATNIFTYLFMRRSALKKGKIELNDGSFTLKKKAP